VINSMTSDPVETVRKLTGGEGADIVIDFTGSPDAQAQGLACTAKLGRFIIVGISHQGLSIDSKTVDRIMRGQITIQGSWNSFSKPFPGIEWTQSLAWFGEGRLTSKPMISHKLTLDEAPAFFRDLAQGKVFFNKIMFLPHGAI
jgi:L-iditol 2-dehydrogenase